MLLQHRGLQSCGMLSLSPEQKKAAEASGGAACRRGEAGAVSSLKLFLGNCVHGSELVMIGCSMLMIKTHGCRFDMYFLVDLCFCDQIPPHVDVLRLLRKTNETHTGAKAQAVPHDSCIGMPSQKSVVL